MGQSKSKLNIIVCGLDNSGKTTIINSLKPEKERAGAVNATIGYNVETFKSGKNVIFTAFDMGGSKKFRNLWESYYDSVEGVVFVVDSADSLRMVVVHDELQSMLGHVAFRGEGGDVTEHERQRRKAIPFLFYANKMDLTEARSPAELSQTLELPVLMADRPFNIFASNALKGEGIDDGIAWLQKTMLQQQQEYGKKRAGKAT